MYVIPVRNVNAAYVQGLSLLRAQGVEEDSRAGRVLVAPGPVTTVYARPQERVLFDAKRDANPFFHLGEALWMISGRQDATWLDHFVSDFSARFAEDDGLQHGAYGHRWRKHFDLEWGGHELLPDQLDVVVGMLRANHAERRAVITMWDPCADLGAKKRDVPCNLSICLRVRTEIEVVGASSQYGMGGAHQEPVPYLDIMVTCRSNDAIYGAYGANGVHMSMLHEYLAGRNGVGVGTYTQCSWNLHAYLDVLAKVGEPAPYFQEYPQTQPIGNDWAHWDNDLSKFMAWSDLQDLSAVQLTYRNRWFEDTATPMLYAHWLWKKGQKREALDHLEKAPRLAKDWQQAGAAWMQRRMF